MFTVEKPLISSFFNICTQRNVIKKGFYFLGVKDVDPKTLNIMENTYNIYYFENDLKISKNDYSDKPVSIPFSTDISKINPGKNRIMTKVHIINRIDDTNSFLMSNGIIASPPEIFVSLLHFLPTLTNRQNKFAMLLLSYEKILTELPFYTRVIENIKKISPYYSTNSDITSNSDNPDKMKILAIKEEKIVSYENKNNEERIKRELNDRIDEHNRLYHVRTALKRYN